MRCGNPTLGRFDSGAAPLGRFRRVHADRGGQEFLSGRARSSAQVRSRPLESGENYRTRLSATYAGRSCARLCERRKRPATTPSGSATTCCTEVTVARSVGLHAWSVLAALAASTVRIRLGPLVASTAFHPPGLVARTAPAIDEVSAGRFTLGVGHNARCSTLSTGATVGVTVSLLAAEDASRSLR